MSENVVKIESLIQDDKNFNKGTEKGDTTQISAVKIAVFASATEVDFFIITLNLPRAPLLRRYPFLLKVRLNHLYQ